MKYKSKLMDRLGEYCESNYYPFHMPGHKRNFGNSSLKQLFALDITEINGFDNLHHPEGILRDCMDSAAAIYGADKTYFLVNGSTGGIMSAISAAMNFGGTILMARNSHKSAFHAAYINHLRINYIYPQYLTEFGVYCGLSMSDVEDALKNNSKIKSIFVVSPTYEGIVSNIEEIAKCAHRYGVPLIVDEAHGAHFTFGDKFPKSALSSGADIVIQSVHKTLPSLTQTALLHVKNGIVDIDKLEYYLQIYQTSSPSYLLMASIDQCINMMNGPGRTLIKTYTDKISMVMNQLRKMRNLRVMDNSVIDKNRVYDRDLTKILISSKNTNVSGIELSEWLREKYYLEMELAGSDYVLAMTSVGDSEEGLVRLVKALLEIDSSIEYKESSINSDYDIEAWKLNQKQVYTIYEAMSKNKTSIKLEDCIGMISGEFVTVYPPGIPIIVPGELLSKDAVDIILRYRRLGHSIEGMKDNYSQCIGVVGSSYNS